jgi:hypothetical protein
MHLGKTKEPEAWRHRALSVTMSQVPHIISRRCLTVHPIGGGCHG